MNKDFEDVEKIRWKYWEKYSRERAWMLGICVAITVGSGFLFGVGAIVVGMMSLLIGWVVVWVRCMNEQGEYRKAYKTYFVKTALEKAFPGCQYDHESGIQRAKVGETGMMNTGDRYMSEDLVSGEYNGVKFEQADVKIQEEHRDSEGNTSYVTVFMGRYIIFDIKKKFDYRMAIVGKRFGARELRNRNGLKKFREHMVESGEFHKRFKIYAEDGFEAFYLLDPAMIERIERLGEWYKNEVAIFFYKGYMHVAVANGKDAFTVPKGNKKLEEEVEFGKVERDIKIITDLVDGLKLVGE